MPCSVPRVLSQAGGHVAIAVKILRVWIYPGRWHAPSSLGLRRPRPRRRRGRWWTGPRASPLVFDRAAVICFWASVASIDLWHEHTGTRWPSTPPRCRFPDHEATGWSQAKYLYVFTVVEQKDGFSFDLNCTSTAVWCLLVTLNLK